MEQIAILCLIYVVGALTLPRWRWKRIEDANGKNWPGYFIVNPELKYRAGIWAQEYFEARIRFLLFPLNVLVPIGRKFPIFGFFERWYEIKGHEIEVQANVMIHHMDEDSYRYDEADALATLYPSFKGKTVGEIERKMKQNSSFARRFVKKHEKRIREIQ